MDQQELLELIGVSKIVLLLVCRGISIVKGIKITVSYLEDLPQIRKKSCLQWWMNYFKDLRDKGIFDDSDIFHTECLRFAFLERFKMN